MDPRQLNFTVRFMNVTNSVHSYVSEIKTFFQNCPAEKFTSSCTFSPAKKLEDNLNSSANLYEMKISVECANVKSDADVSNYAFSIGKKWCEKSNLNKYLHLLIPDVKNAASLSYNVHYGNAKVSEMAFGTLTDVNTFVPCYTFKQKVPYSEIISVFHHLQRHLILFVSNTHNVNCSEKGEMGHKIVIPYESLLRVIGNVDPKKDSAEIFFHLEHPPSIHVTHFDPSTENEDTNARRVSRAKQLEHGSFKFEKTYVFGCKCNNTLCESRKKIGKAQVLKLVIGDKFQTRWLIEQLILRSTTKMEVSLASVATVKLTMEEVGYLRDLQDFPVSFHQKKRLGENKWFNCEYAWKALHSRSLVILHQIVLNHRAYNEHIGSLKRALFAYAVENSDALCKALFHLYEMIEHGVLFMFESALAEKYDFFCSFKELNVLPKGMCFVRRIIITPSRTLFYRPYEHFDNRIIRQFGVEYMLRVSVQDDDFSKLTYAVQYNSNKAKIMEEVVQSTLQSGIRIGSRHYEVLASSSSQLREHGLWLYAKDQDGRTAEHIRKWMGDFSGIHNIAKFMARMGQCLSSTEEGVQVVVGNESEILLREVKTYCGKYIFSDGCGVLSSKLADEVRSGLNKSGSLEIDPHTYKPSAFQTRYRGCKGMVVEDPTIPGRAIGIRPSMKKFECSTSKQLEIVKVSAPRKLYLNKHLITILEQRGVPKDTFLQLQSDMMLHLLESLINEHRAAHVLLSNLCLDFSIADLQAANVSFTNEPFFRSLLLAFFKASATKLPASMRISVPEKYGRNMLGVLDETKTLKYGEVFVQYSESISYPTKTRIYTGPVVVTKNPCLHPGDVRKLTAVDVPGLRHIKDCIVFPAKGKHPHPDEMGGSDLDGDEYVVIWFKDLIFDKPNVQPMHYPTYEEKSREKEFDVPDMVDFFCHYIQNDCIGTFAHAHLVWADILEEGIFSDKCMQIAKNYPYVLDFAKHGTNKYLKKSQRPDQYPDFMQKGITGNSYYSKRALGSLYRVSRVLAASSNKIRLSTNVDKPIVDAELVYPGWQEYEQEAKKHNDQYNKMVTEILSRYNLGCEAEAFAGVVELDLSKKWRNEKMDTVKVVKAYLRNIMINFKGIFCKEVEEERVQKKLSKQEAKESRLRRASAWYMVAYASGQKKILSFPWILSDVLAEIKTAQAQNRNHFSKEIDAPARNTNHFSKEIDSQTQNKNSFPKEIDAKGRNTNPFSKEIDAQARNTNHYSKENYTPARNTNHFSEEIHVPSRNTNHFSKEIDAQARNTNNFSKEIDALSRNTNHFSKEIDAQARNTNHFLKEIDAQARNTNHFSKEIDAQARNTNHFSKEIHALSRNPNHFSKEIDAPSESKNHFSKEIDAKARNTNNFSKEIDEDILSDVFSKMKLRSEVSKKTNFFQEIDADIHSCMSLGLFKPARQTCLCRGLLDCIVFQWLTKTKIVFTKADSTCKDCYQRVISRFWCKSDIVCCSSPPNCKSDIVCCSSPSNCKSDIGCCSSSPDCTCSDDCSPTKLVLQFFKFFFRCSDHGIGSCPRSDCHGFEPRNLQELSLQTLCYLAITRDVYHLGLEFETRNFARAALPDDLCKSHSMREEEGDPLKISVNDPEFRKFIEDHIDEIRDYLKTRSGVSHVVLMPDRDLYGNLCLIVNSFGENWKRWNLQEIVLSPDFSQRIQALDFN